MSRFLTAVCLMLLVSGVAFAVETGAGAGQGAASQVLEEIVVTGSREAEPLKTKPQNVGVIGKQEIEDVKPSHPAEILRLVPGVWIGVTAGEGHMTAIRQPLTTNPVYLYLEDGVPIRPTGFFNHNALYEVDLPQAERIEVTKGPGSALYGSDAIGGTINVLTRRPPVKPEIEINTEAGSFGWYRLLATGGGTWGSNGARLDVNVTHSDGWRERTGYSRQNATLRWDHLLSDSARLKTIISVYNIRQDTSGAIGISEADFEARPSFNPQTFDFRNVRAVRLSTEYEQDFGEKNVLRLIPYLRWNEMDLLPGWAIFQAGQNFFGYNSTTRFYSLGLLAKFRHDFDALDTRLTGGVDFDHSPGSYSERRIQVTMSGGSYVSYAYVTNTGNNFDFDATFQGISPYIQLETSPVRKLRLTAGLRDDNLSYDYNTYLAPNANRPADTNLYFSHVSPKAGLTYDFTKDINGFVSYTHGFRAPSANELFRGSQGTAATTIDLRPIKADSYEAGLRGGVGRVSFNSSVYYMIKSDDIVTFSPQTGVSETLNAGKTEHKGVEAGLGVKLLRDLDLNVAFSYSIQKYLDYQVSPSINYSGNEISVAPRILADTRLDWRPAFLKGGLAELEWVRIGSYWIDDANTQKYHGYDLLNLRASYDLAKKWQLYAKVLNLADALYAERVTKSATGAAQFVPGAPLTVFAGIVYKWKAL
ncbi:MAG: TonB-dependent receptor [Nitrospiraceae bacterium]|nr:TonB-dependent receptor [Nitrospiraceae bacterium]